MANCIYLIITTGQNGGVVKPYVDETKSIVEKLVASLSATNPIATVDWPAYIDKDWQPDDPHDGSRTLSPHDDVDARVTFDVGYLKQDCIVERVYEIQVDRDIVSDEEFSIDPKHYRIVFTKDVNGVQLTVWERIEEEIDIVW